MSLQPIIIPGAFGFGTMSMTWTPNPTPFDKAYETLNHCIEKHNIRFLNGGEFYGPDNLNLKLLSGFWKEYGHKHKDLVISIKGCFDVKKYQIDGSQESIKKSVENVASFFPKERSERPTLIFEIARVDPNHPYEKTISYIKEYLDKGVIDGLSLSEVGAKSIAKASDVCTVSCVEVELSLLCQDILDNGVLAECSKRGIEIVAYSPLCRGFLTERTASDFDAFKKLISQPGDMRGHIDKFAGANFDTNAKVVKQLDDFAKSKNTSLEALSLSWILALSELTEVPGFDKTTKIIPIPSGSTPEKMDKNLNHLIKLTKEDMAKLKEISYGKVVGYRYTKESEVLSFA